MDGRFPIGRLPLLALGALALLGAMWAGLLRLGWAIPPLGPGWAAQHGPLMISGFLGTVISLERAVALAGVFRLRATARYAAASEAEKAGMGGARLTKSNAGSPLLEYLVYLAPLLAGLGGLAVLVGLPAGISRGLALAGSLGLVLTFGRILLYRADWPHGIMALGAALWLAGNGLWWLGRPDAQAAPWWIAFLVLTIAGERLELARLLRLSRPAQGLLLASLGTLVSGLTVSLLEYDAGFWLSGIGLAALGLWLLRYDLARRTIFQSGLPRFAAACLLPGYAWIIFAGALWAVFPSHPTAGPLYDALLHSLLLGFVFSMIFGHAPIIFPAIFQLESGPAAYHPVFYAHLLLLHLGLLMRVAGDLALVHPLRQWGGMLNVVAVLLFLGLTAWAMRRAARPNLQPG